MTGWRSVGEQRLLFSPVGLRLVDDITTVAPFGRVAAQLAVSDGHGGWLPDSTQAITTASSVVTFPGLGRSGHALSQPVRRYRVSLDAQFYRPSYLSKDDGIQFDVYPYDDEHPPAMLGQSQNVVLLPAANYPFPSQIPVLRGVVVDARGAAVPNALVTQGAVEHVLTDERGEFALPIRWKPQNVPISIDAKDERTGRVGTITVTLPDSLRHSQKITIS